MTELEQSLIAIGGTIVVGVFLYNKWQEYRAKKSVERAFSSTHDDVLMTTDDAPSSQDEGQDTGRHEPSFNNEEESPVDEPVAVAITMAEPSVVQTPESAPIDKEIEAAPVVEADAVPVKELPVDEMIDCLIPIGLTGKVWGEKILHAVQAVRHVGNKPVHFVGMREDHVWEAIGHGNVYVALNAGVQLANRSSVLNEIEFSELVGRLRQVGDELDAEPDVPDMTAVMKSARALHHFVNQFDAKLGVNIQSNGAPWAINTLLAALERQGFDLRPDGKLVMPDGDGGVLFMLSTNVTLASDTTSRLTLLLDVPCVAPQHEGFQAMINFAKALATRLGGTVVDDSNQPLSDESLREIAGQVSDFCNEMATAGIAAGSTRALRLFS